MAEELHVILHSLTGRFINRISLMRQFWWIKFVSPQSINIPFSGKELPGWKLRKYCLQDGSLISTTYVANSWEQQHLNRIRDHLWNTQWGMGLGLFNDDTCPSGHISRPTHFSDILCNSFVFFNYVVIWILWFVGFNVPYLTFIDLSDQVEESSLLQIFNDR